MVLVSTKYISSVRIFITFSLSFGNFSENFHLCWVAEITYQLCKLLKSQFSFKPLSNGFPIFLVYMFYFHCHSFFTHVWDSSFINLVMYVDWLRTLTCICGKSLMKKS